MPAKIHYKMVSLEGALEIIVSIRSQLTPNLFNAIRRKMLIHQTIDALREDLSQDEKRI